VEVLLGLARADALFCSLLLGETPLNVFDICGHVLLQVLNLFVGPGRNLPLFCGLVTVRPSAGPVATHSGSFCGKIRSGTFLLPSRASTLPNLRVVIENGNFLGKDSSLSDAQIVGSDVPYNVSACSYEVSWKIR
jgi:hypothetical protein